MAKYTRMTVWLSEKAKKALNKEVKRLSQKTRGKIKVSKSEVIRKVLEEA